jgi:hypothetical protein
MNTKDVNQDESTRVDNPAGEKQQSENGQPGSTDKNAKKINKNTIGVAGAGSAAAGAAAGFGAAGAVFHPGASGDADDAGASGGDPAPGSAEPAPDFDGSAIPVADGVTDDMSFNEAFTAAREETGAGGYFHWHGKWYGTYNEDEWSNLSPEYQSAYSSYPASHPEEMPAYVEEPSAQSPGSATGDPVDYTAGLGNQTGDVDPNVSDQTGNVDPNVVGQTGGVDPNVVDQTGGVDPNVDGVHAQAEIVEEQPEIEILGAGYDNVEGQQIFYAEVVADGQHAALVDLDVDGDFDVVIVDNGTESPGVYEVEIPYEDSALCANVDPVNNDMPDYTNEGNVDSFLA